MPGVLSFVAVRQLPYRSSISCQFNSTVGLHKSLITSVRQRLGRFVAYPLSSQPPMEHSSVALLLGNMRLTEAPEMPIAMVNDVDAGHEKGCGLLPIDLSMWSSSIPAAEERHPVAIGLRIQSSFASEKRSLRDRPQLGWTRCLFPDDVEGSREPCGYHRKELS